MSSKHCSGNSGLFVLFVYFWPGRESYRPVISSAKLSHTVRDDGENCVVCGREFGIYAYADKATDPAPKGLCEDCIKQYYGVNLIHYDPKQPPPRDEKGGSKGWDRYAELHDKKPKIDNPNSERSDNRNAELQSVSTNDALRQPYQAIEEMMAKPEEGRGDSAGPNEAGPSNVGGVQNSAERKWSHLSGWKCWDYVECLDLTCDILRGLLACCWMVCECVSSSSPEILPPPPSSQSLGPLAYASDTKGCSPNLISSLDRSPELGLLSENTKPVQAKEQTPELQPRPENKAQQQPYESNERMTARTGDGVEEGKEEYISGRTETKPTRRGLDALDASDARCYCVLVFLGLAPTPRISPIPTMPSSKNSWAPQHTNSHKETRAPSSRRASTLLSKLNPLPYLPRIRLKSLRSLTLNPYATVRRAKSSYRTYRHTWRRSKPLFFIYTLVLLAMLFAAYLTFEFAIDLVIMGPANATLEWLKYWTVFTLKVHVCTGSRVGIWHGVDGCVDSGGFGRGWAWIRGRCGLLLLVEGGWGADKSYVANRLSNSKDKAPSALGLPSHH
ncbi:hypothetical protein B0T17DRAFT_642243 [Bombardia bombarda]|uniref:Uncharacterized protein n=1 Tax=Bombardia bombarda TaxID=252184 RepID=A0AA39WUL6_9PEZI|nr:hypothetical protein B0T17DRAFT_642243 [Bombardia bombarda]